LRLPWRHRAYEQGLLDEMGRARFLATHMGEAFVGVGDDQCIVFWSPEAEDMMGWMQEEILGRPLSTIQPERYRRRHQAGFDRIRRKGVDGVKVLFENTHFEALKRDGTEVPVSIATAGWRSPDGRLYFLAAFRREERTT
jgi:PAS domain S-box-containing protein